MTKKEIAKLLQVNNEVLHSLVGPNKSTAVDDLTTKNADAIIALIPDEELEE